MEQVTDSIISSLVESQQRAQSLKGMDVGTDWVETQKTIWKNALASGQCTLQELQSLVFKVK